MSFIVCSVVKGEGLRCASPTDCVPMVPTIELVYDPGLEIALAIGAPLSRLNDKRTGWPDCRQLLVLTLKAPGSSEVGGGVLGWTIHVDFLFVPESLPGSGVGRDLMHQAEREAVRRDCHSAWLSTYSFQAPGFYRKLGYREFGELPDYPPGHSSVFLTKRLVPEAG